MTTSVEALVAQMVEKRDDCGVCGLPAAVRVEVTHDGYMVPRCLDHAESPPYQAEARLDELLSRVPALVEALSEIQRFVLDDRIEAKSRLNLISGTVDAALAGEQVQGRAELEAEVASLKSEYHAAATLLRQRTEDLDALREWCKAQGHLPADLPSPSSFDRELRKRLGASDTTTTTMEGSN